VREPFKTDLEAIRQRARQHMEQGAVTPANLADVQRVIDVLNEVVATEIVCVLRYKNHYYMASGLDSSGIAAEFLEHAGEEQSHADMASERIVQLGGKPNLNPTGLAMRSHSEYQEGESLDETYSEIIRWLGDDDPTTRQVMIDILRKEEEHAEDISSLLGKQLAKAK
jgi:bacterioferritin